MALTLEQMRLPPTEPECHWPLRYRKNEHRVAEWIGYIKTIQMRIEENEVRPGANGQATRDGVGGSVNGHQLPIALREHINFLAIGASHDPHRSRSSETGYHIRGEVAGVQATDGIVPLIGCINLEAIRRLGQ